MHPIPPLGWAAIAAVILITLAINGWMIVLLRGRRPPDSRTGIDSHRLEKILRDPLHDETQQLGELSKRVQQLRPSPPGDKRQVERPDRRQ
jgi:hypothetical protein